MVHVRSALSDTGVRPITGGADEKNRLSGLKTTVQLQNDNDQFRNFLLLLCGRQENYRLSAGPGTNHYR